MALYYFNFLLLFCFYLRAVSLFWSCLAYFNVCYITYYLDLVCSGLSCLILYWVFWFCFIILSQTFTSVYFRSFVFFFRRGCSLIFCSFESFCYLHLYYNVMTCWDLNIIISSTAQNFSFTFTSFIFCILYYYCIMIS